MRKISQARHTKIAGTPEHEKCIEKMRKRSQELRAKIAALSEHKKHQNFYKGNSIWALLHMCCVYYIL